MKTPDILLALGPVIKIFDELSISYYIGGSIASSLYGIARATLDIDIVADIKLRHISPLKKHLENDFYFDEDMVRDAIIKKSTFNMIHLETGTKLDIFILKYEPYQYNAIQRRRKDTIEEGNFESMFYFSSPEDIIINKLLWCKMGGEVSERQWHDVVGVIKIQNESLDKKYLKTWSQKLSVWSLLEKAFKEAGILLK
ncbi:MAG: hypothetical protein GXO76_02100 [Calditrichaeota bacterium]|nr:hypothetical protein [Calditrichota bacterium]